MKNEKSDFSEGGYPKGDDLLLLKAALSPDENALCCWQEWLKKYNLETDVHLDLYRLLPLIFENLHQRTTLPTGVEGACKKTFYINHHLMRHLLKVQEMLAAVGIEAIVMKGMGLLVSGLCKPGSRFQFDFDLLVPYDRRLEAVALFEKAGYQPYFEGDREQHLASSHSVAFLLADMGNHGSFDVHWLPVAVFKRRISNDLFFKEKIAVKWNGHRFLTVPPELLLVQVILHGLKIHHTSHTQWVADAAHILRNCPAFDWQKFALFAEAMEGGFWIKKAFFFLVTLPEMPQRQALTEAAGRIRHRLTEPFVFYFFNKNVPGVADSFLWQLRERSHLHPEKSSLAHVFDLLQFWRANRGDLGGLAFFKLMLARLGHFLGNVSPDYSKPSTPPRLGEM